MVMLRLCITCVLNGNVEIMYHMLYLMVILRLCITCVLNGNVEIMYHMRT